VNSPTSSCTTPDATPRTGRGESALPRPDSGAKTQLPFAALPHDLRKDPRLRGKDKAILLAASLLEHARTKPSCSPTNARLTQDLGCCEQTVRTALAHLQDAGWIRIVLGAHQPNGRTIWLLWRGDQIPSGATPQSVPRQMSDTPQPVGPLPQPAGPPPQPIGPKVRRRESEERNVTDSLSPPDPQSAVPLAPLPHPQPSATPPPRLVTAPPPPTVPATEPQRALAPNRPDPALGPLKDALKALPGASPDQVRQSAWRLAHYLTDTASIGFFLSVFGQVCQGLTPVERLLAAFTAADRSRGKARKPGAIFAVTWASWEPAPKPSEINRPVYHQAAGRAPHEHTAPSVWEPELSRAEEIEQLRSWLERPRHPCHSHARRRLAELGITS
jgi:Helix-turn-helix domain